MLSTVLLLVGCDLSDPFKNNNNDSGKDRIICPVIFTTEEEVVSDASNDFAFRNNIYFFIHINKGFYFQYYIF